MPNVFVDVAVLPRSGIDRDANHFGIAFAQTAAVNAAADLADVQDALIAFWEHAESGLIELGDYLNKQFVDIGGGGNINMTVNLYNVTGHEDGSNHGSPYSTGPVIANADDLGGSPLPSEVAAVATIRGVDWDVTPVVGIGTRPRQRRTGRIYIGGLDYRCVSSGGADFAARPDSDFRNILRHAVKAMSDSLSSNGKALSVWSRADATFYEAVAVQVDDAFDTQRRRGVDPTTRETLAL